MCSKCCVKHRSWQFVYGIIQYFDCRSTRSIWESLCPHRKWILLKVLNISGSNFSTFFFIDLQCYWVFPDKPAYLSFVTPPKKCRTRFSSSVLDSIVKMRDCESERVREGKKIGGSWWFQYHAHAVLQNHKLLNTKWLSVYVIFFFIEAFYLDAISVNQIQNSQY